MRIPSQFNEDSLYRRGGRQDETSQIYRRLMRLVIGLALVVVVMRQASKPAIYQAFFGSQAKPSVGYAATLDEDRQRPGERHDSSQSTSLPHPGSTLAIASEDREVANRLTATLSPDQQREWVVALSRWQAGRQPGPRPASLDVIQSELESIADPQGRGEWLAMIDSLPEPGQTPSPPAPAIESKLAAFLASLDDAAASRVVDGSVWRSGDFDAFYRYLDQSESLSGADVAVTGVLPLLQQPDVFRNQLVRAQGGVARAERIEAMENPYGITEYWQLWLRPSEGADRPMVVIVRSVPPLLAEVGADAIEQEGPQVTIVGRYLKRLAYQSSLGADLAPVVVGRVAVAPVAPSVASDSVDAGTTRSAGQWWLILAAACLIGFGLAAIAMWQTAVTAKRARLLRQSHRKQPDEFLNSLRESADHVATPKR